MRTRPSRRLFVSNIPCVATEEVLRGYFNYQMRIFELCRAPGNPILAVEINLDKKSAFLEFRSVEETSKALALDGVYFGNQCLKICRPSDYETVRVRALLFNQIAHNKKVNKLTTF